MSYPTKCPNCGDNTVTRVSRQTVTEKGYIDDDGDFVFTMSDHESDVEVKSIQCHICRTFYKENE